MAPEGSPAPTRFPGANDALRGGSARTFDHAGGAAERLDLIGGRRLDAHRSTEVVQIDLLGHHAGLAGSVHGAERLAVVDLDAFAPHAAVAVDPHVGRDVA